MTDKELADKLADLGARIDARRRDLAERGEFGDVHVASFAEMEARRDALEARMEKAVATGDLRSAAGVELRRDVDALIDNFEEIMFSVGARATRDRRA